MNESGNVPQMPFADERHLLLDGAKNFRDVGGISTADGRTVRRGLLYRSDVLSHLSDADLRVLETLGLKTVVDLRTQRERKSRPDRLPSGGNIRTVHLPLIDPSTPDSLIRVSMWMILRGPSADFDKILRSQYHAYAFHCTESIRALMQSAADPDAYPMVLHCAAGKDRTGFSVAVLLLLLGVSMEDVTADYLLTNHYLASELPRYIKSIRRLSLGRVSAAQIESFLIARAEYLAEVVSKIRDRFGSIRGWLEQACGVSPETLKRIEANLLVSD